MQHYTSLIASSASIVLMSAIYYCNFLSAQGSWLRSQTLQMIMLALLTGMASIAVPATLIGVFRMLTEGLSTATIFNGGIEMASIAMTAATYMMFRSAVKRTNRDASVSDNVTPFTPRPAAPGAGQRSLKKAA